MTGYVSLFGHREGAHGAVSPGAGPSALVASEAGSPPLCPARVLTDQMRFPERRPYLPEVIADEEFQKLFLKLLQGRIEREEQIIQVPRDRLLKARLSEGVP